MRRLLLTLAVTLGLALGGLSLSIPAYAITLDQKLVLLSSFTQATSTSQAAWAWARNRQDAYPGYALDWSTDYCSASPDQPLGFDFRMPCARHDFGYRNYKAVNLFLSNKDRVDDAFYFDLRLKCATYSWAIRPACYSLAWTYYEAVHNYGALFVSQATVDQAAAYKTALQQERGRE
jgi:hypothetical protein